MGVYVFRSLHAPLIKVGHYKNANAWSRVAHRGFYSCKCPDELRNKVSVADLDLLHWFPTLKPADEKRLHRLLAPHQCCGEWFHDAALAHIDIALTNEASACDKQAALRTRRRL
jgi:hypothetical protein